MASLKLSVSPDNNSFESRKLLFSLNSLRFASNTPFSGYICTNGAVFVRPFCKLRHIRVARLENESLDLFESKLDGCRVDNPKKYVADEDNLIVESQDFHGDFDKGRVNIWKKFGGAKRVRRNKKTNSDVHKNINKYKNPENPMVPIQKNCTKDALDCQIVVDGLDFNDVGPESSSKRCNSVLEQLEKSNDSKALRFFEWMKVNGKLKKNVTAYNLILRVLGRKADWDGAQVVIKEMVSVSGCELNYRVFNTLIYACYKSGLVDLGSSWFRMMLDYNAQPNVATFGMLMSLYQKGWAVEAAEYTFSQMRNLKITCQSAYSAMITIYTRMGLHDKAENVIGFLRQDGVVLNRENWLVVLNAYCQQGKLSNASRVLCAMCEAGFPPCIVAYNTMITGYGRVSRMDHAERLFCKIKENGFVPDETTYRSLIEGWGRAGNYKQARFYYMELKRLGFKPNPSNLYSLIRLQAKHEDEEGAITTVGDMVMIGCQKSSVLGTVLQAYEKANRLEKMPVILEGPLYDHVLKNQTSCAILVTAYVKNCLIDSALKVLSEKQWDDPMFENNLYHLLICSCKDLGRLANAVKIFTCMPKPAEPNLNIFCTMIDIYSKMNMFLEAEKLYIDLQTSGVKLDMIAFSVVVRMYVKSRSFNKACTVLDVIDKQNIVPDVYLLRDILRVYQRCGMDEKLADLYYKVLKNGEIWDKEMYNCVINCCARALPVDELSRLFDEMLNRGFAPNTVTFNVMLNAYGKSRLFEKAKSVFWMAKKRGLIDVISYNTIIAAYGKNKYLKNMSAAVRKMQFDGFSVSVETYNCMLDAYGKEGEMDKFKSILQRMKASNCSSDHYTYNILINIYGEQGWIDEVGGVLTELKECGMGLDLCSYNTLIKAYGIAGMVEDAVALVKEMRDHGVEPDRITYTNLINALRKNDMFLEAVKWSLWMKQIRL
ncbi:pentatricopeptide repeat-containing protein at4g30825 chloroplastic [Phtheirospermum japonicum]|uniref:Pentatricopeptide repeat-containing protein at4g30825 chloroplastic n=1 Tax=Phtheirospermum japonicum TaxID=374723 RepID=A0A830CZY3_9LAMI|nr:pentatricopeptide repeat-containing protein at4g30825 chloroplastic [Phtheirospermum japonicum]